MHLEVTCGQVIHVSWMRGQNVHNREGHAKLTVPVEIHNKSRQTDLTRQSNSLPETTFTGKPEWQETSEKHMSCFLVMLSDGALEV